MLKGNVGKAFAGVCIAAAAMFGADNPFAGTWKLNPAKSKLEGTPFSRAQTLIRIEAQDDSMRVFVESTDATGLPVHIVYQATLDGTAATITGSRAADSIVLQRVDNHTINAKTMNNGKLVSSDKRVVSSDGKTMTITRTGTDEQGRAYTAVLVFDKQ